MILVALLLALVFGVAILLLLVFGGAYGPEGFAALQRPQQTASFTTLMVNFGPLLFGFWAASRLIQGKRFGDLVGRWRWGLMGLGFGVWLAMLVLGSLADFLLHPAGFTLAADSRTPLFVVSMAPALALQTFVEEFLFRGVITQGLVRAFKRPWVVCVVSGLVFGSAHILNGPLQAAQATLFGMVLAFMALETGGLALGWGVHLINNLFAGIFVVSTGDVFKGAPGLFRQNTPSLNGFDFAFSVVAMLLAVWFLLRRAASAEAGT